VAPGQPFLHREIDLIALTGGERSDDDALATGVGVRGDEEGCRRKEQRVEQDARRILSADGADESRLSVLDRAELDGAQAKVLNVEHDGGPGVSRADYFAGGRGLVVPRARCSHQGREEQRRSRAHSNSLHTFS